MAIIAEYLDEYRRKRCTFDILQRFVILRVNLCVSHLRISCKRIEIHGLSVK